jgi:hypothetical protein
MLRGEVNPVWGSRSESESEQGVSVKTLVAGCRPEAG